ncbi:O-antigen ligase family protein [Marinobacter sp. ATCH36]|uniref:O-antigen ligase family protein n=1 Tax=Marinobacter sp. ATCH36 TaxID=2945106 RepID=UPI002020E746|nr:O-antigen ligase family protein [Marinobacter sp. ATCH36]MCL7945687.1 O-antigen ligase family protein [Marinobacter sp. ATCH36]
MKLGMMNSAQDGKQTFLAKLDIATISQFSFVLYLYFILDFFLRFSARIPGYGAIRPTLLVVAVISLSLFLQRDKLKGRFEDPIFKAIFVLFGYLVISLPLVEWPGSVVRANIDPFIKAVVFLFFTALIIDTERRLRWFIAVFVLCQVFRVLEPLYLHITQGYWGSSTHLGGGEFAGRLSGAPADVINPNELGFVIVTAIPFLHYLLWPLGWKSKLIYLAIMPALLYSLILTMSRGAFIALLVVAFLVFKKSKHKMKLIFLAVVVALGALSVMTPIQKDRYLSLVDSDTAGAATAEGRLKGMVGEFKLGLTRPVVGHGLGTTPEAKTHKLGERKASHNLYAELMIELGLIGFVIFLRFLYQIARKLSVVRSQFAALNRSDRSYYSRLNKCLIAVFWMYAVYSLNYWGLSQYYWYLLGGLVIAFGRLVEQELTSTSDKNIQMGQGSKSSSSYPLADRLRR